MKLALSNVISAQDVSGGGLFVRKVDVGVWGARAAPVVVLDDVFQLFTPYKEVLPIYNAGLKVPDDVMILGTEDNHG